MLRAHGPVRVHVSTKQVSKQARTRSWQLDVFIPLKQLTNALRICFAPCNLQTVLLPRNVQKNRKERAK